LRKFEDRHIGTTTSDREKMLKSVGVPDLDALISEVVPGSILRSEELRIGNPMSERDYLKHIRTIVEKNEVFSSYIGQGYYGTITPPPILRNIFENPGWYTQYTPYQAEISQGRMEALLNFQTVISDLTALPIANASLLDEPTAVAEAMAMFHTLKNKRRKNDPADTLFVDRHVFEQTKSVLKSRSEPIGIDIEVGDWSTFEGGDQYFGVVIQYPNAEGQVEDYRNWTARMKEQEIYTIVAADILSLTVLTPPGEWGADAVVGNTQRFGVPMGFGGPHAAYFATHEDYKRVIPGRIIGVSVDTRGEPALRMALQTREQHIKRERATSNICTAQALLAIMAGMYGVYHGPQGVKEIAQDVHNKATWLVSSLKSKGISVKHDAFFDTICISANNAEQERLREASAKAQMNFGYLNGSVVISVDESTMDGNLPAIVDVVAQVMDSSGPDSGEVHGIPARLVRTSGYMTHEVFHSYNSETEVMRYIKRLENRDLSLMHSMIPLGSCTMKLNAATELIPVSWHGFANMHPFAPKEQSLGYRQLIEELEKDLADITGLSACSLMPNSGAQGELTGLLTIRAYHKENGEGQRNVALIPSSAHGTNPASAVMAGMKVIVVKCDEKGNVDVGDLQAKAEEHKDNLAALIVTYPSTHGVYETAIKEICSIVHNNGGLVYMDGANMNAQVGLTSPGEINADVCHLNLHKTFAIPHGGGGPGVGPICVNDKLAPYLPGHAFADIGGTHAIEAVNGAPWGSASVLLISYAYIKLLGSAGLKAATENAILNANYLESKLKEHFSILYTGEMGRCAHEFILDLREYKSVGISAEDIAKRLIDYGFHAPTLSFPVAGTFMIEPTESESKGELDRFCNAMIQIKKEIDEVARGEADPKNNVLTNAPHTVDQLMESKWNFPYTREKAVFPLKELYHEHKFWPAVTRVNNAHGDRNLICICPPIEDYQED